MINKVIYGDCLEIMDNLIKNNNKIDVIITDPPYEFKKGGFGGGQSELSKRALKSDIVGGELDVGFDIENIFDKFKKLQDKCNICIFCAEEQMIDICNYARENKYYYTILVWYKTNPTPLCNNRYLNSIEFIVHIREKGVKILGNYHSKSKVYVSPINKKDKTLFKHPTVKPLELIEKLIKNHTKENQTVLDPFAGSGTTAIACMNTKRNYILIEKEKKYINIINKRIKNTQLKLF